MKISTTTLAKVLCSYLPHDKYELHNSKLIKLHNNTCFIVEFTREKTRSASANPNFAINLGLSLNVIREFDEYPTIVPDNVEECHWIERVMNPSGRDQFWLKTGDKVEMEKNIRAAARLVNNNDLLSCCPLEYVLSNWQQLRSPGITEYQRVKYLSIMHFKQNNPEAKNYLAALIALDQRMGIVDELLYNKITGLQW